VSANENAFLSFGLQQSEIAPMSFTAARKYGEALRFLLSQEQHHLRIGGLTWIYWTRAETDDDPLFAIKSADPEEVEKLLNAPRAGLPRTALDANDFYALAVSANTSRMVVRSWITTTLDQVQGNIALYFAHLRLLDREGQPRYHRHTALAGSLVREFKDLPDHVTADLLNTALWGRPLPLSILHRAVQRARAEREHVLTHPRAALIKLVLRSNHLYPEDYMPDHMNPAHPHPAYQCGRLLALLDNIQQKAVGARATLVDRYYGAASATPASVFGVLMRNAQHHLGKLRKTESGLAYYFEQKIAEIARTLDSAEGFPRTLTMQEQGLFALGFYQERHRPRQEKSDSDAPAATH
jgi:CRISPR-associated protein Csd1